MKAEEFAATISTRHQEATVRSMDDVEIIEYGDKRAWEATKALRKASNRISEKVLAVDSEQSGTARPCASA
jgi:hypothetical protein